jgi:drug/metabolite transporter (DMT)-like permease
MRVQEWLGPYRMTQLRMSFLTTVAGTMWLLLAMGVVLMFGWTSGPITVPDQTAMTYFVIVGVGAGALSIWLWNVAVSRIGLPVAALYGNLTPVCAVGFAWLFGASIAWLQILGGLLIIAGVVQMQVRKLWSVSPAPTNAPSG